MTGHIGKPVWRAQALTHVVGFLYSKLYLENFYKNKMSLGQKITMWVFGLLISAVLYLIGMSWNDYSGNAFIAIILPLLIIGGMFFVSFKKK